MHDTSRYLPSETSAPRKSQTVIQKINLHLHWGKKNENRVDFDFFCFGNVMLWKVGFIVLKLHKEEMYNVFEQEVFLRTFHMLKKMKLINNSSNI